MKLLLDHIVFQSQKIGGVSKALIEMVSRLPHDIEVEIAVRQSDNLYLNNSRFSKGIEPICQNFNDFLFGVKIPHKDLLFKIAKCLNLYGNKGFQINNRYCLEKLKSGTYDVFQPTHYNASFLPYNKKPFVQIIHDLIPEKFSEYYKSDYSDIVNRNILVPKADMIVAISENTKKDIIERWKIPENKIKVIYWGAPDVTKVSFRDPGFGRYILYVGGRKKYKNFSFFMKESVDFLKENEDVKVVCTGAPFERSELELLNNYGIANRCVTKIVSDDELLSLYKFAMCFVFPSLYEGFGLPTLEAMACGCPVLISSTSCFKEIGGNVAYYIEQDKEYSNISTQLSVISKLNKDERKILAKRLEFRAQQFSWRKTALQYSNLYKSLL